MGEIKEGEKENGTEVINDLPAISGGLHWYYYYSY